MTASHLRDRCLLFTFNAAASYILCLSQILIFSSFSSFGLIFTYDAIEIIDLRLGFPVIGLSSLHAVSRRRCFNEAFDQVLLVQLLIDPQSLARSYSRFVYELFRRVFVCKDVE